MNIVHVAALSNNICDGIRSVLQNLSVEQRRIGNKVTVINILDKQFSLAKVISGFKSDKPDIVVFHSVYKIPYWIIAFELIKNNIPYLIEPHGGTSESNSKRSKFKKIIANILFVNSFIKKAGAIIYLNDKEERECVFSNIRKSSIVIPNGVNIQDFETEKTIHKKIRFIYLSSLRVHHKGLDVLLEAISLLKKRKIENVEFHFYGNAENEKDKVFFMSKIADLADYVVYHGPVHGSEKENAYRNSDIFILTSRYEGMPMSVLEALSYGLPCLLTAETNMIELIEQNDCGCQVFLDEKDIANKILSFSKTYIDNTNILRLNSYNSVKDFSWKSIAKLSVEKYVEILSE